MPNYHTFTNNSICEKPEKNNNSKKLNKNCNNKNINNKICILNILQDENEDEIIKTFANYKCYLQNNHEDLSVQCTIKNKPKVLEWTINKNFMKPKYVVQCINISVKNKYELCLDYILDHVKKNCITIKKNEKSFSLSKIRNELLKNNNDKTIREIFSKYINPNSSMSCGMTL